MIRRPNTNKTQILHRIRLKNFVPNQPLENIFQEERLQPDEKIIIPQDDLYMISCETNFGEQLATRGNHPIPTSCRKTKSRLRQTPIKNMQTRIKSIT